MSNLPPEPPDPPLDTSQITHKSKADRTRRGRGRGRRNPAGLSGSTPHDAHARREPTGSLHRIEGALPHVPDPSTGHRRLQNLEGVQREDGPSAKPQDRPRRKRRAHKGKEGSKDDDQSDHVDQTSGVAPRNQGLSRRAQFGAQLTQRNNTVLPPSSRRSHSPPPNSDLATRLTHVLRAGPPHPDCPICFNPLYPGQPTWSCSLSTETASCCWTSFHLKCVREWARKSTRETRDAFAARGETRDGEWRCPGCQTKRSQVPQVYLCFCGAVTDPKPGISTPHSCGMPCSRKRESCEHPCPLSCHPGPCPTCVLTVSPSCHCSKVTLSIRCGHFNAQPRPSLSCGKSCNKILTCGTHFCERECHPGDCTPCGKTEIIRCYCGKHSKQADCGEGLVDKIECVLVDPSGEKTTWDGRYSCGNRCEQSYTCGLHTCSKTCHPPTAPSKCPFDVSVVTHCPCGKNALQALSKEQRTKCTDTIPTCTSLCGKRLQGCSHDCSVPCHVGECPPCNMPLIFPCRCGAMARHVPCHERQHDVAHDNEAVLCEKVCGALRLCGRHQCSRVCCPLAHIKTSKGKKRIPALQPALINPGLDDAEKLWHQCDLLCGKLLGCGSHKCQEADHRGPCPPCLRSSFEERICHCGGTVIFPPIACGTRLNCSYPCNRPPPPCGHDKTSHTCHEDPEACPPCPFLTTKACACGKANINNVRCSQQKVSCGQTCGKPLGCGFHRCQKLCHDGHCGTCSSICGKPKKSCLPFHHLCPLPCHAPSACNESQACETMITASCPCGRFQQPMKCGRCSSNPSQAMQQLHCRDECNIAKRNARLAEALGISAEVRNKVNVAYSEELLAFGKANPKFVVLVENTLNDFVSSDKKTQVLPYMPDARRKFVRELCQLYRIDTQLVDQEPRRSVQLYRRIDSRTPSPLLSASMTAQNGPNFGKLADLRATETRATPAKLSTGSFARGWTSVVSSTPQSGLSKTSVNLVSSDMEAIPRKPPQPHISSSPSPDNIRESWEED